MGLKRVEFTPRDIDEQVRGLMSERHVAPDYLLLFQEVFEAQYQTETRLRAKGIYLLITKEEAGRRLAQGLPIIDSSKLQLDEGELADLLQRICAIIAKQAGGWNSAAGRLLEAINSGQLSLSGVAQKAIAYDGGYFKQVSEEMHEDEEVLAFIAKVLVAPFLRVCAASVRGELNLDLALTKRCPVCGGAPRMAKLQREDGKRMLECSLCDTQWAFERLRCPLCGNEDQDTLGFFFVEGDSACRVDKCDKCKRYIKTVDERKRAEDKARALAVEDVATLYLDMLAEKEGYQSIK